MKALKNALISYILPTAAVGAILVFASGFDQSNSKNKLCNHQYALCTSALCVPMPGDSTQAICFCDVEEGPSLSTVDCESLKPTIDSNGIRTIYSTYSFKQFESGKKAMKCPNGTPWTWCLNKRCTVDPSDAKKAICTCDVVRKGEWMTLGGNCDTSTCTTGYWSGATMQDNIDGNAFLTKVLGLNQSPVKWCATNSP
jgi:hypothetical protein